MVSSDSCLQNQLENRLRFEQIISDVSARFINLPPEKLDGEIEHALKMVLEFFQVDRCGLLHALPGRDTWKITHLAASELVPPIPTGTELPRSIHPWSFDKLTNHGEMVVFSTVDDMPDEARVDKQTWKDWGIRSNLVIPIFRGETAVHIIAINAVKKERAWPEEYIPRLRLLGEIILNFLQLAHMRQQLKDRLRFEGLISDLSAGFVNVASEEIENQINKSLEQITEFFAADRCSMGLFNEDGTLKLAFEYHLEGIESGPVSVSKDQLPWYISQLMQGKFVVINRLDDLPANADAERRLCQAKSIKSLLSIPLVMGQKTLGSCALVSVHEERVWPEELVQRMRLLAEVFAGALARKRSEESLRESEMRMNLAANSAEAGLWTLEISNGHIWATEKAYELYGFVPGQELNFEDFIQIVDPGDRARIRRSVERASQAGGDFQEEYRIILPDGTVRWIAARGRPSFKPTGEPEHLMGVSRDVSERKQLADQLEKRLKEVENLKLQLEKENLYLREEIELQNVHEEIVGRSQAMKQILVQVEQVARTDATVLIEGETGTGKELLARAVHRLSARKDRPLVTVNCASLPPTLIESELFGREKGAYTGALTRMTGRFELADRATIFLDEIGELPLDVQAKLLRVLEQGQFERLGSTRSLQADVRIIAASNRELARDVAEGKFRKDLYYRLNVFPISVPPLRERPEDIPLLVWSFVRQYEKKMGKRIDHIPRSSMENLQHYPWPGNARELRNVVEHAMIVARSKILDVHAPRVAFAENHANLTLAEAERRHIQDVLQKSGWRLAGRGGAAEILGLKRTTLQSKMKKLGIKRPRGR